MTWIDTMPLTSRGKIDRSALPDPVIGLAPDLVPRAPGADEDRALSQMVAVWEGVLGTANVGPDDNFFDAGGHSLLAIRLMDSHRGIVRCKDVHKRHLQVPHSPADAGIPG